MLTSLYFFITYTRKQKENINDIHFIFPENKNKIPECIYIEEEHENKIYSYAKIFKVDKSTETGKERNNYYFEYKIDDEKYIISFDSKGKTFIYDVKLEIKVPITNIDIRRKINQNKEYNNKNDLFIEALKQNGEKNLIDELFKETIELYSLKKGFSFLIELFLKVYQKKDLCPELLRHFREINENQNENGKNMDRKSFLKRYTLKFNTIIFEADKLIINNNYKSIEFYGIILCYLNYYDYDIFNSVIKELFTKRPEDLFEILVIYNAHFKYPIYQDFDFFNKFINYAMIKKEFFCF